MNIIFRLILFSVAIFYVPHATQLLVNLFQSQPQNMPIDFLTSVGVSLLFYTGAGIVLGLITLNQKHDLYLFGLVGFICCLYLPISSYMSFSYLLSNSIYGMIAVVLVANLTRKIRAKYINGKNQPNADVVAQSSSKYGDILLLVLVGFVIVVLLVFIGR